MPTTDITSTVQHLTFHDDIIETIPYEDTRTVSLRRICENLSVDYSGQLQKLKNPNGQLWRLSPQLVQTENSRLIACQQPSKNACNGSPQILESASTSAIDHAFFPSRRLRT